MRVQIGSERYDSNDPTLQTVLAAAHGEGERANCLCTDATPELYIAHINGGFCLKRMPGTGQTHDAECPHYEINAVLSGRGAFEASAIVNDPVTNLTTVKLGFSMSHKVGAGNPLKEVGDDMPPPAAPGDFVAKASAPRLTLRGLMDLLYEEARLSRFYPKMAGKRFWGIVSRELKGAAQLLRTPKQSLSKTFFIPNYAKVGEFAANNQAALSFIDGLKPSRGVVPDGFVFAQVHSIDTNFNNPRIILRYCNETVTVPARSYERFALLNEAGLEALRSGNGHFMILARVHREGTALISNQIVGMHVDENWIPVPDNVPESRLIDDLNAQGRAYQVVLRYGAPAEQVLATAILLDSDTPKPIFVAPLDEADDEGDESEMGTEQVEVNGLTLHMRKKLARWHAIVRNESPEAMVILPGHDYRLPPKREKTKPPSSEFTQPQGAEHA